jgi:hypothetical protein
LNFFTKCAKTWYGWRKTIYKRRQAIVEPVFANIKHNLRFRKFLLRGLKKVKAEFTLMAIVYNIQKIAKFLKRLLFSKVAQRRIGSSVGNVNVDSSNLEIK